MPNHWDLTCKTMWDILSLIFWVILKGSCLLKTRSSQIMRIYMEKPNTFGRCQELCISHRNDCAWGFFPGRTENHIRSLALTKMSRCLYGGCQDLRREKKLELWIWVTTFSLHLFCNYHGDHHGNYYRDSCQIRQSPLYSASQTPILFSLLLHVQSVVVVVVLSL